MDDLAITNIHSYMTYSSTTIEKQVSRTNITGTDCLCGSSLCSGSSWQRISEMLVNSHNKSGAVGTIGQACTSPDIWVTKELHCIVYHIGEIGRVG